MFLLKMEKCREKPGQFIGFEATIRKITTEMISILGIKWNRIINGILWRIQRISYLWVAKQKYVFNVNELGLKEFNLGFWFAKKLAESIVELVELQLISPIINMAKLGVKFSWCGETIQNKK